jgi:ribosomal protein S24E
MTAKTKISGNVKRVVEYLMSKVELGHAEILMSSGVTDYNKAEMIADFERQASLNPNLTKFVWHTSLNFAPGDEERLKNEPELRYQIAAYYLEGMGLDNTQVVVTPHYDTDNSHIHIVANRVAYDGKTVTDKLNYYKQMELMREIEVKYNLTKMVEQKPRKDLNSVPEFDSERIQLRDQVRSIMAKSTNRTEFIDLCKSQGIQVDIVKSDIGTERGITFTHKDSKQTFKGSKLGKDLSLKHIGDNLSENARKQSQNMEVGSKIVNTAPAPVNTTKKAKGQSI